MARPTEYTEKDYRKGFEELVSLNQGNWRKVTPSRLFKHVGGQYPVAAAYLEKFKAGAEKKELETHEAPAQSEWFVEMKEQMLKQFSEQLDNCWPDISEREEQHRETVTAQFHEQKRQLDEELEESRQTAASHMERLNELEPLTEELRVSKEALENMTTAFNQAQQERDQNQIKLEAAEKKATDLGERLGKMTTKRDEAVTAKSEQDGQLKSLQNQLDTANSKIESLASDNAQLQKDTESLEPTRQALKKAQDDLEETADKLKKHEDKAEEHTGNAIKVATLSAQLEGKDQRIEELSGLAEDLQRQINDLNQQVGQLSALAKTKKTDAKKS